MGKGSNHTCRLSVWKTFPCLVKSGDRILDMLGVGGGENASCGFCHGRFCECVPVLTTADHSMVQKLCVGFGSFWLALAVPLESWWIDIEPSNRVEGGRIC